MMNAVGLSGRGLLSLDDRLDARSTGSFVNSRVDMRADRGTATQASDRIQIVPSSPWLALFAVLGSIALGISAYLAYVAFTGSKVVGCGSGAVWDCEHVFHSRWAKWWGLPVSLPASGIYVALLASLAIMFNSTRDSQRHLAWNVSRLCVMLAASAGVWFIYLQFAVVGKLCIYCITVHSLGIVLFALSMIANPPSLKSFGGLAGVAALGMLGLVTGQFASQESPTFEVQWSGDVAVASEPVSLSLESPEAELNGTTSMDSPEEAMDSPELDPSTGKTAAVEILSTPLIGDQLIVSEEPQNGGEEPTMTVMAIDSLPTPSHSPVPDDEETKTTSQEEAPKAVATTSEPAAPVARPAPQPAARTLNLSTIHLKFETRGRPVIGDPQAPVVFVELFDYTCAHCRRLNRQWKSVEQRFGDRVSLMPLVVPLCQQCNGEITSTPPGHAEACEIGLIALAVWRLKPDQFAGFHDWLCETENGHTLAETRAKAETILDRAALSKELSQPMISRHLSQHVQLYGMLQRGTLPKLVSEKMTLTGVPDSNESLCAQVEAVLLASNAGN